MSNTLRLLVGSLLIVAHGLVMAGEDRLQRIQTAQTLRVCIWPDYYGISFRNPKTLQLSGIDVDLARELARELGVAVSFVDSSFATLIEDVLSDRCDIAMFAIGLTQTFFLSSGATGGAGALTQPAVVKNFFGIPLKAG